jgi:hypothetical protein
MKWLLKYNCEIDSLIIACAVKIRSMEIIEWTTENGCKNNEIKKYIAKVFKKMK